MNASAEIARIRTPERWAAWARHFSARGVQVRRCNPASMRWLCIRPAVHSLFEKRVLMPLFQHTDLHFTNVLRPLSERTVCSLRSRESRESIETRLLTRFERAAAHTHSAERRHAATRELLSHIVLRNERHEDRSLSRDVVMMHAAAGASRAMHSEPPMGASRAFAAEQWMTTRMSTRSAPAAPVNVEQITENVMRQLDRRIEAWRERTGRR